MSPATGPFARPTDRFFAAAGISISARRPRSDGINPMGKTVNALSDLRVSGREQVDGDGCLSPVLAANSARVDGWLAILSAWERLPQAAKLLVRSGRAVVAEEVFFDETRRDRGGRKSDLRPRAAQARTSGGGQVVTSTNGVPAFCVQPSNGCCSPTRTGWRCRCRRPRSGGSPLRHLRTHSVRVGVGGAPAEIPLNAAPTVCSSACSRCR